MSVVSNAASSGVTIDRRHLKSLARRTDVPGLVYLASWAVALALTGSLVWLALGTVWVWPAMFIYGVAMSVPSYSLSHETAHGDGLSHAPAQRSRLLVHLPALRRRAAAPALHPHQSPHVHLPVANEIGVHPIHFAAIVGTNLGLGNVSPPCAPMLYMAAGVSKLTLDKYVVPTMKLLMPGHLPMVLVVTFFPELALWLPRLVLGIQ